MSSTPNTLFHLVNRPPRPGEAKPPLLLLLHGVGSNEEDLFSLAPMLDDRLFVVAARGPIALQPGAYAWYHVTWTDEGPVHTPEEAEESRQRLVRFLEEVIESYGVDPERVFVGGFSQGGAMTFCLATTVPEKLAGAMIMSGRTIPEMEARIAAPEQFHNLPILIQHGTRDNVLPVQFGRELKAWFEKVPVDLNYKEYGMAHEISGQSLNDLQTWLANQLG